MPWTSSLSVQIPSLFECVQPSRYSVVDMWSWTNGDQSWNLNFAHVHVYALVVFGASRIMELFDE